MNNEFSIKTGFTSILKAYIEKLKKDKSNVERVALVQFIIIMIIPAIFRRILDPLPPHIALVVIVLFVMLEALVINIMFALGLHFYHKFVVKKSIKKLKQNNG